MGKTIQMHEGEAKICADVNFVGVGASKVKFVGKGEVKVWLTEKLVDAHVEAIENGTPYQVIGDVTPGRKDIRMTVPIADETQPVQATEPLETLAEYYKTELADPLARTEPTEGLGLPLPQTGEEGVSEEIKALQEIAPEAVITVAPITQDNCQHPEWARLHIGETEVCRRCTKVLKTANGNGHEDVEKLEVEKRELKRVNAELLDRVMQLEQALEVARAQPAAELAGAWVADFDLSIEYSFDLDIRDKATLDNRRLQGWTPAQFGFTSRATDGAVQVSVAWQRPLKDTPSNGHETAVEVDTVKAEDFPEPAPDAAVARAVLALEEAEKVEEPEDAPEPTPEPVFEKNQRVLYNGAEVTIQELGREASVHILIDRPDGRQEARCVYIGELKRIPEPVPALALDASTEDAPKLERPACPPFPVDHPRINAPGEAKRFGHLAQWQMAGRAGQKVSE